MTWQNTLDLLIHEQRFVDQDQKPAWRVLVLTRESMPTECMSLKFEVSFVAHHGLADGTSWAAFHKSLYHFLSVAAIQANTESTSWPYIVPDYIKILPFVDVAFAELAGQTSHY